MALSKFLDPKCDLTFRRVFGTEKNKNILIHFINDILGLTSEYAIQDVEFLATIMVPEIASDKQSIVDILCKDSTGRRFVVEMQVARDKSFQQRAQLYAAQAYSRQLDKSGNYVDLKTVYFIAVSNCNLFLEDVGYISTHNIREIRTNGHYLKDLQFIFIELPKFSKTKVEELENTVERWCYFFKYAEDTTEEDLKKIAEQAPVIKLAYDEIDRFGWKEKDLVAYEERILSVKKEEAIWAQRIDDAKDQGRLEGIHIGEEKGRLEGKEEGIKIGAERGIQIGEEKGRKAREIEVAKNLLKANVSIDIISQTTGLPISEIKKLQKHKDFSG
ncbi:Rpn family recombination-promoting nuclease/putative transposase [Wolbachia endosymbiont (group A) of Volucella inflata]|uniref:Rpn family recombination-promoting nuclease/putative transposase n=1 Tax=Wolbachia endosymbiont (group A) of Volucella inflata TaxID=2954065 RepID=UPI0022273FC5|nr:Rpn family recombination-promoting nuclease/putative transposase [Wolbachia endosymbiont (group A) of Volucella inflata]